MRIISQDGRVDLPYEQVAVQINNLNKKTLSLIQYMSLVNPIGL